MQKSLKHLRENDYLVDIAEKWIPHTPITKDLFGFIDIAGLHKSVPGVIGVQTTTFHHMKARKEKILNLAAADLWIKCGNTILLHGWDGEILHQETIEIFTHIV